MYQTAAAKMETAYASFGDFKLHPGSTEKIRLAQNSHLTFDWLGASFFFFFLGQTVVRATLGP